MTFSKACFVVGLDRRIEELRKESKVEPIVIIEKEPFEIDKILDKINESGIDSITKEEKEFLDNLYS